MLNSASSQGITSWLLVYSITNMTMSDDIWEQAAVCPLMADETDAGMEALSHMYIDTYALQINNNVVIM